MRAVALTIAASLVIAGPLAGAAMAQPEAEIPRVPGASDFSEVKSLEAAKALAEEGKLEAVLLFPAEVGGPESPFNTVYLPLEAAAAKRQIDATIARFADEGLIDQLDVQPVYRGDSFIPARIVIKGWHSETEKRFEPTLDVW